MSEQNTQEPQVQTQEPQVQTQEPQVQTQEPQKAELVAPKPKKPLLPAFEGQGIAKVQTFKAFAEGLGHDMKESFKGEAGKILRKTLNAQYTVYTAKFSADAAGNVMKAMAAGLYTIPKASKDKNGNVTVSLKPTAERSKLEAAKALIQSLGGTIVLPVKETETKPADVTAVTDTETKPADVAEQK